MQVSITDLQELVFNKLNKIYDDEDSKKIGDVIMYSELSGMGSHGLLRLVGGYYDQIDPKRTGKPEIKKISQNVSLVDGKFNSGMLILSVGTDEAISLGSNNPISLVGMNNSKSTAGYISYFLRKIAKVDLIGIIMVRAMATSVGFGSKYPLFGTNPIGFAIPGEEDLILDMGTSAITYGALMKAQSLGQSIPEGIAYDKAGNLTTDPTQAMEGSLLTFDKGYKSAGLAMIAEILAGILTGAGFGKDINSDEWGNIIITIKPDVFISKELFTARLKEYITFIKSKNDNGRLPGENSLKIYTENIKKGSIEVDDSIMKKLGEV